jgi:hypothetical protein
MGDNHNKRRAISASTPLIPYHPVFSEAPIECLYCIGIILLIIFTYILSLPPGPVWWMILLGVTLWILAIIGGYFLIRRALRRKGGGSIEETLYLLKSAPPRDSITTEVVYSATMNVKELQLFAPSIITLLRQIYTEIMDLHHLRVPRALYDRWKYAEDPLQDEVKGVPPGSFLESLKQGIILEKWCELDLFKAHQREIDSAISAFNNSAFRQSITRLLGPNRAIVGEWMRMADAIVLQPLFERLFQIFRSGYPNKYTNLYLFLITDEIYYLIREIAICK